MTIPASHVDVLADCADKPLHGCMMDFAPLEVIERPSIRLRPTVLEDAQALFEGMFCRLDVMRDIPIPAHVDAQQTLAYLVEGVSAQKQWDLFRYVVECTRTSALVAYVEISLIAPRAELMVLTSPAYRVRHGRVFLEILRNLLDWWLYQAPVIYRLSAVCSIHSPAHRLIERLGFIREGTRKNHQALPNRGLPVADFYQFAKTRPVEPVSAPLNPMVAWLSTNIAWE